MRWIHSTVTGRRMRMVSPTARPAALATPNEVAPEGTYASVKVVSGPTAQLPLPRMAKRSWGMPVILISVPPVPEPLPRRTTPLALMLSVAPRL
jgi:hypothetical protein